MGAIGGAPFGSHCSSAPAPSAGCRLTTTAESKVKAGNSVTVKVDGPAVVRITRLGAPPGADQAATMPGLAEAVALLTARHHGIDNPGLSGDVPPSAVAAALVTLGTAFLAHLLPADHGARLLQDLGAAAADEQASGGPA